MDSPEHEKKSDVRRPMNAFLIFCKRHRSMVREKNPDLDNRSVTRILGDLWAKLGDTEKSMYTTLAKQYKDAFMKANPDYKWHNPDKGHTATPTKMTTRPTNARVVKSDIHLDGSIMPGKLADPSKMGGLSLLLMAGQQSMTPRHSGLTSPDKASSSKSALLELAEMCANELQQEETTPHPKKHTTKEGGRKVKASHKKDMSGHSQMSKARSKSESDSGREPPMVDILKLVQAVREHDTKNKLIGQNEPTSTPENVKEKSESMKSELNESKSLSLSSESLEKPKMEKQTSRVRSWSESAKDSSPYDDEFTTEEGDFTEVRSKDRSRRMSQSETIAGCLSDQNDNAIVSCGKLVVDHIVEKLFSTDIAQAAMKLKGMKTVEELKDAIISGDFTDSKSLSEDSQLKTQADLENIVEAFQKEKSEKEICDKDVKKHETILKVPNVKSFLESNECLKRSATEAFQSEASEEIQAKKKQMVLPLEEGKSESVDSSVSTPDTKGDKSDPENDDRDREDGYQPVRKSRRRNRGQRYLELINEGIIQPSKERLAARRAEQTSTDDESLWCYEDIVMEEEIHEVRRSAPKRSGSDSDTLPDDKKYKTGDFDLEAQIATLPACSLDPVSRYRQKTIVGKVRHHSEGSSTKKPSTITSPTSAVTMVLPPHVKLQSAPAPSQPVSGSRKRKARKHSINHLIPASATTPEETDKLVSMETTESCPSDVPKTEVEEETIQSEASSESPDLIGSIKKEIKTEASEETSNQSDASTHETMPSANLSMIGCQPSEESITADQASKCVDKDLKVETSESDVLDYRTSNVCVPEDNESNAKSVLISASSSDQPSETLHASQLPESCILKTDVTMVTGSVLSDKGDNSGSVLSDKGDNSLAEHTRSQFDSNSQEEKQQEMKNEEENSKEEFSSASSVNIVAFTSAATTTAVDLVSLSTTTVGQSVSLDVLGERAEDSPTSSVTRSPLAAGSPSMGVVHS